MALHLLDCRAAATGRQPVTGPARNQDSAARIRPSHRARSSPTTREATRKLPGAAVRDERGHAAYFSFQMLT
ncbi:hypothetical protein PUR28_10465 [Streptomyces sp. BE308]|uniref:hypothetical protein n=1 Tax=Streptomyces sp. BE308 TaxID=3002529 RepID=UPI002E75D2D8|nr:hypothetical protein [Streptomyces sp. BE308]MEE1791186.1 hypothetical protein [Streptomyces sp. BE308]